MRYAELTNLRDVLPGIASRAQRLDQSGQWPEEDLRILTKLGAMRWAIPMECGGEDLSAIELHFRYEAIASASLSTALVISQRDSAISMIDTAEAWPRRCELLQQLSNNQVMATIGIAQLTTSHQSGPPALLATRVAGGWKLQGIIPWSTGAAHCDYVVAGAATEDGQQILFVLPMKLANVLAQPPLPLVALRSSWTSQVSCDGAIIEDSWVLQGPAMKVLGNRKRALPVGQSFLALGLCSAALDLIAAHDSPAARTANERFTEQFNRIRQEILDYCSPGREAEVAANAGRLRGVCNDLAVRLTEVCVALYKGSSLLADHPAQRLAREAMFLLVWSCPSPVVDCTVDLLSAR